MGRGRRYAGSGKRGGVAKLVRGVRPALTPDGKGRGWVRGRVVIFTPIALDRDGRKALRHLLTRLGCGWEACERYGDAAPGCTPSAIPSRRAFAEATALRVWVPTDMALAELRSHRYCRRCEDDATDAGPGAWDGTKLAPAPFVPGVAVDVRETAKAFQARWYTACGWVGSLSGFDDETLDVLASACCDYLASHDSVPASVDALIAWVGE